MSTWLSFVTWVNSIPAVIWSGAIGAVLTLIGVFFVNGSNTKRLRLQLDHDREQKERDRLAALRRDVYLQAPKEAIKALSYLSKLPSRDLTTIGDDEGIEGFGAVAAQIGVLSELPTVEAVGRLGNSMAMELLTALSGLSGVQDTRVDIHLSQQRLDVVTAEIQRIQAQQQTISESGVMDPQRQDGLTYWLGARMEEAEDLRMKLDVLRARHQRLLFEYHRGFFDRMPTITQQNIQVMRSIRQEIGLAYDLDQYVAKMDQLADDLRAKSLEMIEQWAKSMEVANLAATDSLTSASRTN